MDNAKKEKTRRESTPVKVWVTAAEKAAIAEKAAAHCVWDSSRYVERKGHGRLPAVFMFNQVDCHLRLFHEGTQFFFPVSLVAVVFN